MTLPNPTSRLERDYFSGLFSDERTPVVIREVNAEGAVLGEEIDYREEHAPRLLFGCRYLWLEDGTAVNIDMPHDNPERYQPPNEWQSHQQREDWYAKYRNASP